MKRSPAVLPVQHEPSVKGYIAGYVFSIAITLEAYWLVQSRMIMGNMLLILLGILGLGQFVAQSVFFLHLSTRTQPRWKLLVFAFMLGVVFILVAGSIWIMYNLNYHMMSPAQMLKYLNSQDGI